MKSLTKVSLVFIGAFILIILQAQAQTSPFSSMKDPARYQYQLEELNSFLEGFDDGNSGQVSVEKDSIIIKYPEGQYCKFKVEDMADPVLSTRWSQINWDCLNESQCVETDWTDDGRDSGVMFSELGSVTIGDLMDLLQNFIAAYKGE